MFSVECHELELLERLSAVRVMHPHLRLFGLIDGTCENPGLDQFFLLAPDAEYDPLFLETDFAACVPHSPYLFELPDSDDMFLREWGCWAENRIIWWLSAVDLAEQVQHWRSLITVLTPELDTAIFRFWDSQVLSAYLENCSVDEFRQLLAPCHTVFAPQGSRYWRLRSNITPAVSVPARKAPWWQVQPRHLQGLTAAFERLLVDEIEDGLWRMEPARLQNIYAPALPALIHSGIRQAHALGLTQDTAVQSFLRCQIRFGFEYWQHEALASLWQLPLPRDQAFLEWAHPTLAGTA